MRRSVLPKVVRCSQGCKGHDRAETQVSGLFYVVGVYLLVRWWMVGKWSNVVQSSNRMCIRLWVVV